MILHSNADLVSVEVQIYESASLSYQDLMDLLKLVKMNPVMPKMAKRHVCEGF